MKILHVVTRLQRAGSERNILNLVQREIRAGHEVTLAAGLVDQRVTIPGGVRIDRVSCLHRPVRPLADLRAAFALRALVRSGGYDVVFTHQSKAGIVGRIATWREPVLRIHCVHMPSFGEGYSPLSSWIFRGAERLCARRTDVFVAVGPELRDLYVGSGIGSFDRFRVIRSPIDVDAFAQKRPVRAPRACDQVVGGRYRLPRVAVVGALEARKRTDLVLERLAPLLSAGEAEVVVAGEGPARARLERLVERLGIRHAVTFAGYVGDVAPLLADTDVLVHGALVEGVPQVVIQALAAGVPVVTTTRYGLGELGPVPALARVDTDAGDIVRLVREFIVARPEPIALHQLEHWRPDNVAAEIDEFIAVLAGATTSHRPREVGIAAFGPGGVG